MNNGGLRPAPGNWTVRVAERCAPSPPTPRSSTDVASDGSIKKYAPKTLVMDGSFARTEDISKSYAPEVLASDAVDIISWHYYGASTRPCSCQRLIDVDGQALVRRSG